MIFTNLKKRVEDISNEEKQGEDRFTNLLNAAEAFAQMTDELIKDLDDLFAEFKALSENEEKEFEEEIDEKCEILEESLDLVENEEAQDAISKQIETLKRRKKLYYDIEELLTYGVENIQEIEFI